MTPTEDMTPQTGAVIAGAVHGGQQPIVGAHLYLLAAGTGGYGTASQSLLTTNIAGSDSIGGYVITGAGGNFSISNDYSCAPGAQVYVYALGGNSGSGTNSASGLMAALGTCPTNGTLSGQVPFLIINEVTTVAAAYSLAGFATDATHIGSSGTAQALVGVKNAFATAASLANIAGGTARTLTPEGNGTVPASEIDTLANILASCINSTGPSFTTCSTLLADAKSAGSTGTAPTDTATAAINIAHNPGVNTAGLYALAGGTGAPFQPSLTSQPSDFSVSVVLSAAGNEIAIDAAGNVWEAGYNGVVEYSPTGGVISPVAGFTGGGYAAQGDTWGIAIDPSSNVWTLSTPTGSTGCGETSVLSKFSASGSALTPASGIVVSTTANGGSIAIDGTGSIWVANPNYASNPCTGNGYNVTYITPTVNKYTNAGVLVAGSPFSAGVPNDPYAIAIDNAGNVWIPGEIQSGNNITYSLDKLTNAGAEVAGFPYALGTNFLASIAIDSANSVWGAGVTKTLSTGVPATGSPFPNAPNAALGECDGFAVDGAGNVWCASEEDSLGEISNAGVTLSPNAGYVTPGAQGPLVVAIDPSGNVWSDGAYSIDANFNLRSLLVKMVGVATPTVTPLSVGVKNAALGTRP